MRDGQSQSSDHRVLEPAQRVMRMVSDLNTLRTCLEARRSELQKAIAHLRPAYSSQTSTAGPAEGVADTAEMARDVEEQAEQQSMFAHQRRLLDEIEQALQRLDRGSYGLQHLWTTHSAQAPGGNPPGSPRYHMRSAY